MPFRTGHEACTVRVDPDGRVLVVSGVTSQGQGLETTLAQVVAEEFGIAPSAVRITATTTGWSGRRARVARYRWIATTASISIASVCTAAAPMMMAALSTYHAKVAQAVVVGPSASSATQALHEELAAKSGAPTSPLPAATRPKDSLCEGITRAVAARYQSASRS